MKLLLQRRSGRRQSAGSCAEAAAFHRVGTSSRGSDSGKKKKEEKKKEKDETETHDLS